MAVNIFDQYGVREVANVYFEALDDDIAAGVYKGDIVLFLDTLKVSTIETSAQNAAAQGGWGNPRLVQWDYGKEINVTLEDALLSLESLRFMLGGAIKHPSTTDSVLVHRTAQVEVKTAGVIPKPVVGGVTLTPTATTKYPIRLINLSTGVRTQLVKTGDAAVTIDGTSVVKFKNPAAGVTEAQPAVGDQIRIFWVEEVTNAESDAAIEVTISPDTFPGTYKIVGDTLIRKQATGRDEPFQFVINKAKVQSSVTITLQADGDPSTFEMQLNVLRSTNEDGNPEMMKLVRYSVSNETTTTSDDIGSIATA